jgi:mannan endo-1,4-beta-mannosidase
MANFCLSQAYSVQYDALLSLTNDTKIIALSEVGSIPDPAVLKAYEAHWVYFCVWTGDFISGGQWNDIPFLQYVYNDPYVLTLDEIQGWKYRRYR